MRIDAHQHFWRYDPTEYPWIPPGSPLQRDWLPHDLADLQRPLGLEGSIAVQARQSLEETRWLLSLTAADPRVKGVVGWVDLRSPQVESQLQEFAGNPLFVGVRHVVQDEPDDNFMLRPDFIRGIGRLHEFGLTYDILIYPRQLPAAIELVRKFPDQPFVLDHIAKPLIRDRTVEPWRSQIRELAQAPNLMCKVSGLLTEADHRQWKAADFQAYLDVVFTSFGIDRLMWGSDWPVCLLAGSYEQAYRLVTDYVARMTDAEKSALFGGNCARFYGIRPSTP